MKKEETRDRAEASHPPGGPAAVGKLAVSCFNGDSPIATEFQRLYSRLGKLSSQLQEAKVFLITSPRRGEGKTTTSALLAQTAALHSKKKIVVVDCDLRKPRLHELFGLGQRIGVVDVLAGLLPLSSAIKNTDLPNLKVITSGRGVSVPMSLFESGLFKSTIDELRASFDLVIIDTAPVLPVVDAFFIAGYCDGVILVVMAGKTPVEIVARAKELLTEGGAKILGAIVNNVEEVLPYYYDYGYYNYKEEGAARKARK